MPRSATATEITDPATLDAKFAQAVTDGCEGPRCSRGTCRGW
jgi:hypothetical protein